jgi:type IV secretion system protein VirD4
MSDKSVSNWRDLAGKAAAWSVKTGAKGLELAKAEVERQKVLATQRYERHLIETAEREERERIEAAAQAERDRLAAIEAAEKRRLQQIETERLGRTIMADRLSVLEYKSPDDVVYKEKFLASGPNGGWVEGQIKVTFCLSRSLASMSRGDAEVFLCASLLNIYDLIPFGAFDLIRKAIIYNDGNCFIDKVAFNVNSNLVASLGLKTERDKVHYVLGKQGANNKKAALEAFFGLFSDIERANPDHRLVKEFRQKLLGGSNWLSADDLAAPAYADAAPTARFIGATEGGQSVWFNDEGAVITIAPPGSGKTQCHVFPTLLSYRGPAVVLDVKGECWDHTSAWRRANVGPVFRFSPLDPASSARYNPLAFLTNDPETLWEECRLMADLLIVPENKSEPSWENRARDVVAAVLASLVRRDPPEQRSMGRVIDVVSKIGWDVFVATAASADDLPPLRRIGNALADMPEKQLEGVLDSARRHLAVWEGARVERVTAACDWTAQVLRDGSNSTVYICIPPNEIESYAPLLRVLFAQHLRQLMRTLPPRDQTPILFMLDEFPRLGPMRPVEEALEIGRQYGIRLWLFAQSLGQLETAYANADGMVGSCAMRIYMNPSAHDGTAKRLSEELGFTESIIDDSRKLMVEPSDLTGPDYAALQIVLARNSRPARLKKVFAWQDQTFRGRMGRAAA